MAYTKSWLDQRYFDRWGEDETTGEIRVNSTQSLYSDLTQYRAGEKLEHWKLKLLRGENAGTPFSSDRQLVLEAAPCNNVYTMKSWSNPNKIKIQRCKGYLFDVPTTQISHLVHPESDVDSEAKTKILKKIRERQQHMNSPAVLAEILDVLRQFGKPFEGIVSLTNDHLDRLGRANRGLRGSRRQRKINWARIIAETYLEYSFGLSPLISDTKSVAETFARWNAEEDGLVRPKLKLQSRSISELSTVTKGNQRSASPTWHRADAMHTRKSELGVQYICGMKSTIQAAFGSNQRLLQLLGFDHQNWIPGLYEAIPWSWLLDYFLNIQEILEGACTVTTDVKWVVKTVRTVTTEQITTELRKDLFWSSMNAANYYYSDRKHEEKSVSADPGGGRMTVIRKTVVRTLPASLGIPSLVTEHPFSNVKKVLNLLAVFHLQRNKSRYWTFAPK